MSFIDRHFDELVCVLLIVLFLAAWALFRNDKLYELCFGSLTALLGILRGKHAANTQGENK